ncbi:MAG: hypothetical protein WCJ71_10815 [Candidatus Omnitrophota bacterium]
MNKRFPVLLLLAMVLCTTSVSAEEQTVTGPDPFPLNKGSIYAYSDDKIPDVCFFPSDKARWDGFKVMAADWKKLTDYQKSMFISDAAGEIERNEDVTVDLQGGWKVLIAMNEGIKNLEKEAPDVAKEQTMLRFLLDTLKAAGAIVPRPELVGPEAGQVP